MGIPGITGPSQTQWPAAQMGLDRATLNQEKKLAQELYSIGANAAATTKGMHVANSAAGASSPKSHGGTGKIVNKLV